jgi:hypothetical protein
MSRFAFVAAFVVLFAGSSSALATSWFDVDPASSQLGRRLLGCWMAVRRINGVAQPNLEHQDDARGSPQISDLQVGDTE